MLRKEGLYSSRISTWKKELQNGKILSQKTSPLILLTQQQTREIASLKKKLAQAEAIIAVLHSERFSDATPYEVFYTLLDEGKYLTSIRTMYRLLFEAGESKDRRHQRHHRDAVKPELMATTLIQRTTLKHGIKPGQLTMHSDNGPSITSQTVSQLLENIGVLKTHNRPYTSNDNPFSESQFKTLKY